MHDLRHEAVSRLSEKGLSMEEVVAVSGHTTSAMLARYTHLRRRGWSRSWANAAQPLRDRGSPSCGLARSLVVSFGCSLGLPGAAVWASAVSRHRRTDANMPDFLLPAQTSFCDLAAIFGAPESFDKQTVLCRPQNALLSDWRNFPLDLT